MRLPDPLLKKITEQFDLHKPGEVILHDDHFLQMQEDEQAVRFPTMYVMTTLCKRFSRIAEPVLYQTLVPVETARRRRRMFRFSLNLLSDLAAVPRRKLAFVRKLWLDLGRLGSELALECFLESCVNLTVLCVNLYDFPTIDSTTLGWIVRRKMPNLKALYINLNISDMEGEDQMTLIKSMLNASSRIPQLVRFGFDHSLRLNIPREPITTNLRWDRLECFLARTLEPPSPLASVLQSSIFRRLRKLVVTQPAGPISSLILNRKQMPILETLEMSCLHVQNFEVIEAMDLARLRVAGARTWMEEWTGEFNCASQLEMCDMDIWLIADGINRIRRKYRAGSRLRSLVVRRAFVNYDNPEIYRQSFKRSPVHRQLQRLEMDCKKLIGMGMIIQPANLVEVFRHLDARAAETHRMAAGAPPKVA